MSTSRCNGLAKIHAHRGASSHYPENTMAAFYAARDLGADAIEFDVHLTEDGHLVVVHDYDLARTTSGAGYVFESSLEVCAIARCGISVRSPIR